MSIKLSDAMQRTLRWAPERWGKLTSDSPSIDALRKRGLIELRDVPGAASGALAGYQWRITETGRIVAGRAAAASTE